MFPFAGKDEPLVVLLIDDDLVSREVTATLLTLNGYTVHTAEDGSMAVKALAEEDWQPDLILMDAQMPGLTGAELVNELRALSRAPIYAVSASEPPSDIAAAVDGFLLKPFNLEMLRKLTAGAKVESAQSAFDPNEPVIRAEILANFRKMMPESAVRQIYEAVVNDLGRRIEALSIAISRGDAAEIRRIGHAIKGGCGMAGVVQAAHVGALFETSLLEPKDNQLDNSAALLRDLRTATQGLQRMLDAGLPA
jgi:CheY-like chemotaxis protein